MAKALSAISRAMILVVLVAFVAAPTSLPGQEGRPWLGMDYGPFLCASIEAPTPAGNMTHKAVAIPLPLSSGQRYGVIFDTDLLRWSVGWIGSFVDLRGVVYDGVHGLHPEISGRTTWSNWVRPGWSTTGNFTDPRALPYGPIPERLGRWGGIYLHGDRVLLSYTVGETQVLETPEVIEHDGRALLARTVSLTGGDQCWHEVALGKFRFVDLATGESASSSMAYRTIAVSRLGRFAVGLVSSSDTLSWRTRDESLQLEVPAADLRRTSGVRFRLVLCEGDQATAVVQEYLRRAQPPRKLNAYLKGGPPRWSSVLRTQGTLNALPPESVTDIPLAASDSEQRVVIRRFRNHTVELGTENPALGDARIALVTEKAEAAAPVDLESKLFGYWSFDEGSGALAADAVREGRSFRIENPSWRRGYQDRSLEFEGRARAELLGPTPDFRDEDLTISVWIQTAADGTILSKASRSRNWMPDGKSLFVRDGRLCYDIGWVGVVESKSEVADSYWHHVAMTYESENSRVTLYVDGELETRRELRPRRPARDHSLRLGYTAADFPESSWFQGRLDELRIYQRALTAAEISVLADRQQRRRTEARALIDVPLGTHWEANDEFLELVVPPLAKPATARVLLWEGFVSQPEEVRVRLRELEAKVDSPYRVDAITWPADNPWQSWLRFGDFDFFADANRAAISTWSGDVWIVEGLSDSLAKLRWRRIATGLAQPLGLEIIDDKIYVVGRDQITRLHDLNGDGEIDYYENFNNHIQNSEHFHEFCLDLETDDVGNLYFLKAARHARDGLFPHHGTLVRVGADGKRLDVLARGLRAPNGLALAAGGRYYTTDQEGHWIPANRINVMEIGGYYGNAWTYWPDGPPKSYEPPLCWIHPSVDRSPSQPLWVDSSQWGVPVGSLLCLSYGTGRVLRVHTQKVGTSTQGGISPLPLRLPTGLLRGRFHPDNGQLHVCGLYGWSSEAQEPGGFYRIRYTGQDYPSLTRVRVLGTTLELQFAEPLSPEIAQDTSRYQVKAWGYQRSERYGSPRFDSQGKPGVDSWSVTEAAIDSTARTIRLTIPKLTPTMQIHVEYDLMTATGRPVTGNYHGTIHSTEAKGSKQQ